MISNGQSHSPDYTDLRKFGNEKEVIPSPNLDNSNFRNNYVADASFRSSNTGMNLFSRTNYRHNEYTF